MAFKDLDKDQRLSMNRNSVRTRTTLVQRWASMSPTASPGLVERARIAAGFIKPGAWVADIGCGSMVLEPELPEGVHYIPVDCVPRDDRTVIVDLNKAPLPPLAADVIVGLGVLEYLEDVPSFLAQIQREAIFTYAPVENSARHDRASSGWFNAYSAREMTILFEQAGFEIMQQVRCPGRHVLWHLQPRSRVVAP